LGQDDWGKMIGGKMIGARRLGSSDGVYPKGADQTRGVVRLGAVDAIGSGR
jgi:hypothetical protein